MRIFLIILGIFTLFTGAALAVLSHPAFGLWRHRSTEHIQASPNFYDGMFQNQEPTPQFTGDHQDGKNTSIPLLCTRGTNPTAWHIISLQNTIFNFSTLQLEPLCIIKHDKLAEYGQFGTINGQIGRQMNFGTFIATFRV